MNLKAMTFAVGALMLSSTAAYADHCVKTQSMETTTYQTTFDPQIPAVVAPTSTSGSSYTSERSVNYSIKNVANDTGTGTQNFATTGVDYGVGPNITGPTGNLGFALGEGPKFSGKLRKHTAGFPPHKRVYMIYDNNVSVNLPAIR